MSNYSVTLKNSRDEIRSIVSDIDRQLAHLNKEIAEKSQTRDSLMKQRSIIADYGRLLEMEMAGK